MARTKSVKPLTTLPAALAHALECSKLVGEPYVLYLSPSLGTYAACGVPTWVAAPSDTPLQFVALVDAKAIPSAGPVPVSPEPRRHYGSALGPRATHTTCGLKLADEVVNYTTHVDHVTCPNCKAMSVWQFDRLQNNS